MLPSCRFNDHCLVDERTRRQCPRCRLAKCFAVGMQKELIRTDEERAARLQLVKANRLQRYRQRIDQRSPQNNIPDTTHESAVHMKNFIVRALSSNDWMRITNIRSSYEHCCLYPILRAEEEREDYLSTQPIKCRLKDHSFIHVLNIRLTSLVAYFRETLEVFSIDMNNEDRNWLIRANLHYLFLFSSMDLMNINGNRIHFDSSKSCHSVYVYVYGHELIMHGKDLIEKLHRLIGFDPAIGKIMQIILFLSPCLVTNYLPMISSYRPSLGTILRLINSQEQYVEILWAYLMHRYGENGGQKLYVSLIGQVLQHQKFGADKDRALIERQPFRNLIYELLTSFSID
jgi:hypothetical protein